MDFASALILELGLFVVKTIIINVLKMATAKTDFSKSIFDLLEEKGMNIMRRRTAARHFEEVADEITRGLLFEYDYIKLDEGSLSSIVLEIQKGLRNTDLSLKFLASISYNPKIVNEVILKNINTKFFSEQEVEFLRAGVNLISQNIIDIQKSMEGFNVASLEELLKRTDDIKTTLVSLIKKFNDVNEETKKGINRRYELFERDYRKALIRKYDKLNLYGVRASIDYNLRNYILSSAYVELEFEPYDKSTEYYEDIALGAYSPLSGYNKIIISGEAGTGKTTLLRWLAVKTASLEITEYIPEWENKIPFILELRSCYNNLPCPDDFVKTVVDVIYNKLPDDWITEVLESGNAVLLIDGFDEVPFNKRDQVFEWIEDLVENYEDITIIITTRPAAKDWDVFTHNFSFSAYTLKTMSMTTIHKFIEKWHKTILTNHIKEQEILDLIENLYTRICSHNSLKKLASYPLLCAMICSLNYKNNSVIPTDKNTLYEECCEMLIERRDADRNITHGSCDNVSYREKKALLSDLAYWMQKNNQTVAKMENVIEKFDLKKSQMTGNISNISSQDILVYFLERSGLIHRTFQEYLSGELASRDNDWGLLLANALSDNWRETILIALGFANFKNANRFISKLIEMGNENNKFEYFLLASACLTSAVEVNPEICLKVKEKLKLFIPPQNNVQVDALIFGADLSVPLLQYYSHYTDTEADACIKVLSQIETIESLNQLDTYLNSNWRKVIMAIKGFPPVFISNSKVKKSIQEYINNCNKKLVLFPSFVNVLWEQYINDFMKDSFDNVKSIDFFVNSNTKISVLNLFKNANKLRILTNLAYIKYDLLPKGIESLILVNKSLQDEGWGNINALSSLKNLKKLAIESNFMDDTNFYFLKFLTTLESLTIITRESDVFFNSEQIEDIGLCKSLKELHFISELGSVYFDTVLSPIASLPNLEKVEFSFNIQCEDDLIDRKYEIIDLLSQVDENTRLKKLIIRTNINQSTIKQCCDYFKCKCDVVVLEQ